MHRGFRGVLQGYGKGLGFGKFRGFGVSTSTL